MRITPTVFGDGTKLDMTYPDQVCSTYFQGPHHIDSDRLLSVCAKISPFMEFYRRICWCSRKPMFVMACSHCTRTGPGQGMGQGANGTNMLYRNVDTVQDRERNPDPLIPIVLVQFRDLVPSRLRTV